MRCILGKNCPRSALTLALIVCVSLAASSRAFASASHYQYPLPGAELILPETDILIRPGPRLDRASVLGRRMFSVVGSKSGAHEGALVLAPDGRTLIFRPDVPFSLGETVSVRFDAGARTADGQEVAPSRFEFRIQERRAPASVLERIVSEELAERGASLETAASPAPATEGAASREPGYPRRTLDLPHDFPPLTTQQLGETAPGYVFLADLRFVGTVAPYLMILDNSGNPVFIRRMDERCVDFKMQPNGLLTYYDLEISRRRFYAMNSIYAVVDSFACGNGYSTDLHELVILPNGHALLMSYDPQVVDMSQVVPGGNPDAVVIGLIIQELDEDKNVVFQWRSWDHFEITDATEDIDLTAAEVDYSHGNAIEMDGDGHLMISSRNMDEITKIDRFTGNIIWRLGGENNQFTFFGDSLGFSHQHDIRRTATGTVTLFDNGNLHDPPFSRAVEYALDEEHKIAVLVWQFRHTPELFGFAMGSTQRLPNGNTLIGWGSTDVAVTEVDPYGNVVFELAFEPGVYSYRAFRFEWTVPVAVDEATGRAMRLSQNFPNPFRDRSTVQLTLPRAGHVQLTVHDVAGREVRTLHRGPKSAGQHRFPIDGADLDPGIYFCRLATDEGVESIKMILLD